MLRPSLHALLVGATALALGACASRAPSIKVEQARQALNEQAPCCKSLAEAKATLLPMTPADFTFDQQSPVFQFDSARGYFTLFRLPAFTTPYSIDIESTPTGSAQEMSLLLPQAQLLDDNFNMTRAFGADDLRARGHGVERVIFINPGNATERYLLVYATDKAVERERIIGQLNTATMTAPNGFFFNVYTGNSVKTRIMASPVGSYHIQVDGLAAK